MVRKNMEKYGKIVIVSTTSSCKLSREREYLERKYIYYIGIYSYLFLFVSISKLFVSISKISTFFSRVLHDKKNNYYM